jgi:hypothetical protein
MRASLLLSLVPLVAPAHYRDWVPGSCDLQDAEGYLSNFGIDPGLPKLDVMYGHFTTEEIVVHGAETVFAKGKRELEEKPRVKWEQTGKYTDSKYMVLMIDADSGGGPGQRLAGQRIDTLPRRPRMVWMTLNAKKTASSGHEVFSYAPPSPGRGRHRYIVILFQQVKPGNLNGFMGPKRAEWDFEGFMNANREALKPISYNYFVVDAELTPEAEEAAKLKALGYGEGDRPGV